MTRRLLVVVALAALVAGAGCEGLRIRYLMNKGHKEYKAQNYDAALVQYRKIVAIDPDNYIANYQIAMSNLAMYHPGSTHPKDLKASQDSITAFEKLLKMQAPDAETADKVKKYYFSLLTAAGQENRAISYIEGELRKTPDDASLWSELASYLAKGGDFPKTLAAFEKAAELDSKKKERWYTVGVVCWERSYKGGASVTDEERTVLIEKGHAALDKALAIDPDYFDALAYKNLLYREKAKVLANMQDLEAAQDEIRKAEAFTKRAMEARKKQQAAK